MCSLTVMRFHSKNRNQCRVSLTIIWTGIGYKTISLHLCSDHLKYYLRMEYETWLLSENLLLTSSGKTGRASASKFAEWVSAAWKKVAGKTVEQPFKKYCSTNTST
jgi:hypothetical protein